MFRRRGRYGAGRRGRAARPRGREQHDQDRPGRLRGARNRRGGRRTSDQGSHQARRFGRLLSRAAGSLFPEPLPNRRHCQADRRRARAPLRGPGRLSQGHRRARQGRPCAPGHSGRLPPDAPGICGGQGSPRVYGEELCGRRAGRAPRDQGRPGGGAEESEDRQWADVAPRPRARRRSAASTTARSARSTPCAPIGCTARSASPPNPRA